MKINLKHLKLLVAYSIVLIVFLGLIGMCGYILYMFASESPKAAATVFGVIGTWLAVGWAIKTVCEHNPIPK